MAETPEGPMPGKEKRLEDRPAAPKVPSYFKNPEYDAVIELIKMLRGLGVAVYAKCVKCGAEGSLSVIRHPSGYHYLVMRHPDRSTHVVPRNQLDDVLRELCEVKKDLEYVIERFKKYEERGIRFCGGGRQ
jgi:hypothetical protein